MRSAGGKSRRQRRFKVQPVERGGEAGWAGGNVKRRPAPQAQIEPGNFQAADLQELRGQGGVPPAFPLLEMPEAGPEHKQVEPKPKQRNQKDLRAFIHIKRHKRC